MDDFLTIFFIIWTTFTVWLFNMFPRQPKNILDEFDVTSKFVAIQKPSEMIETISETQTQRTPTQPKLQLGHKE